MPATPSTGQQTPAPWVPFTRAGCSVGDFSTANMVLENTGVDIPTVFGPIRRRSRSRGRPSTFKDAEVADYVGVAVHCAQATRPAPTAQAVKYGQTTPSASARSRHVATEPGGYNGYQGLFGARYVAPQLGAGTPNLTHNGYPVTECCGQPDGPDVVSRSTARSSPTTRASLALARPRSQSLAYMADMQESGCP